MKKITFLFLFLFKISFAQTITRSFPIAVSSVNFSLGSAAPITQTPDNGYLLNYAYSYPNWDVAPGYQSTIVKTDSDFVPQWSKKLVGGNGKKTIVFDDGSMLLFSDSGNLLKLDSNGQTIFSKGNFATYPIQLSITDAERIGTIVKVIGSVDTYADSGYVINSVPVMVDLDSDGNLLQTYTVNNSSRPTNISKDTSGNYYLTGYSYFDGNYIYKINSDTNAVVWAKKFKSTIDNSIITINDLMTLANGDVILVGYFYNYSISLNSIFMYRLSANGTQISAKATNNAASSSLNSIAQLSNGDLVVTGFLRENENSFNRNFTIKMDNNESISWSKLYNSGFGISAPFIKSDNDWYYSAFNNNYSDHNNPILFNTDNTGITSCPYDEINLNLTDVSVNLTSIDFSLTPTSSLLTVPSIVSEYPTVNQVYVDACLNPLSANESDFKNDLSVYPNPSKGRINFDSGEKIKSISVWNASGQEIQRCIPNQFKASITINSQGLYFIKAETEKGTKTAKIVISN